MHFVAAKRRAEQQRCSHKIGHVRPARDRLDEVPRRGALQFSSLTVHGATWWLPSPTSLYRGHGRSAPTLLPNPCPTTSYEQVELAAANATHVDALCTGDGAMGSMRGQLRGSSDGGATWRNADRCIAFEGGVSAVSDNEPAR